MAKNPELNFNTVLCAIIIGLCTWIGKSTLDNSRDLAVMRQGFDDMKRQISEVALLRDKVNQFEVEFARIKQNQQKNP